MRVGCLVPIRLIGPNLSPLSSEIWQKTPWPKPAGNHSHTSIAIIKRSTLWHSRNRVRFVSDYGCPDGYIAMARDVEPFVGSWLE